ncbi:hypothetical protein EVAR_67130_1 [Eumeta japonica]|uniref:Uncharacterized protein n=1 Tax=Eumeta variegata TaxID=151549 RepID=A0A4C1ZXG0_EUMVA|nr:hypothetical protein EVAR_67130_1 [Eumeta japonica]
MVHIGSSRRARRRRRSSALRLLVSLNALLVCRGRRMSRVDVRRPRPLRPSSTPSAHCSVEFAVALL